MNEYYCGVQRMVPSTAVSKSYLSKECLFLEETYLCDVHCFFFFNALEIIELNFPI